MISDNIIYGHVRHSFRDAIVIPDKDEISDLKIYCPIPNCKLFSSGWQMFGCNADH